MLNDQAPRHDLRPDSNAAKLARALAYLRAQNIYATDRGNCLRYTADANRVLRRSWRAA